MLLRVRYPQILLRVLYTNRVGCMLSVSRPGKEISGAKVEL